MNLDRGQRKIARQLLDVGTRRKETRKEKLAALVTALTEANLGNPNYGDADSVGWRQERSHYGPVSKRLNVKGGARRFYNETSSAGKTGTVGELAQAVQRSAFPDRYQTHVGSAKEILAAYNQGRLGNAPVKGRRSAPKTSKRTYTTPGTDLSAERSAARIALLTGSKGLPSSGELLAYKTAVAGLKDVPGKTRTVTTRSRTPARGKPQVKGGKVKDYQRAGKLVEREVLPIAQQLGIQVTPRSVRASNASHGPTISGSRSDHQGPYKDVWAADMSNGSAPTPQMDKLARRIAKKFGIPWSGSGLVNHEANGYRYQLIYKTNEGGNHFNHVHFGARKL